jgi:hypothetical protein
MKRYSREKDIPRANKKNILMFEEHQIVLAKAREILTDYNAGKPLNVEGHGWLIRFAVAYVHLHAEMKGLI